MPGKGAWAQLVLGTWKPKQRGPVSSEGLCKAGPRSPDFERSPWLYGEAGFELWRRRSHQETVASVQQEMMAAWTRLLAVGIERSRSFQRELGGSFIRTEDVRVVGRRGAAGCAPSSLIFNNQADVGTT